MREIGPPRDDLGEVGGPCTRPRRGDERKMPTPALRRLDQASLDDRGAIRKGISPGGNDARPPDDALLLLAVPPAPAI